MGRHLVSLQTAGMFIALKMGALDAESSVAMKRAKSAKSQK
jgi:hypothetical protein